MACFIKSLARIIVLYTHTHTHTHTHIYIYIYIYKVNKITWSERVHLIWKDNIVSCFKSCTENGDYLPGWYLDTWQLLSKCLNYLLRLTLLTWGSQKRRSCPLFHFLLIFEWSENADCVWTHQSHNSWWKQEPVQLMNTPITQKLMETRASAADEHTNHTTADGNKSQCSWWTHQSHNSWWKQEPVKLQVKKLNENENNHQ
jgi:hypothetical protein